MTCRTIQNELFRLGISQREIARRLGVSPGMITYVLRSMHCERHPFQQTCNETKYQIIEKYIKELVAQQLKPKDCLEPPNSQAALCA